MAKCFPEWDEHAGYKSTGKTQEEKLPNKTVVWQIWKCQCGKRASLMKGKTKK